MGHSGGLPTVNSAAVCTFSAATHSSDPETAALWHQRLGHMNFQALYHLVKDGHISGIGVPADSLRNCHSDRCEVCVMAKHRRAPAPPREARAESIMDVLHSDVCVYPEVGLDGSRYAVTLMDECSSYAGVATLSNKSGVAEALQAAILKWENMTQRPCKRLFTDRGGEYLGESFQMWCAGKGIIHEKSIPHVKYQNGKAERLNQTMNDHMRAMLLQYNLDKRLWPYALRYSIVLYNVGRHKSLHFTRFQAFLGKVPNVKNYRTFGCRVFARLNEHQRSKLDPKSELGIYLGPANDGAGHQVLRYRPDLKGPNKYSVQIFRDVVTYENLSEICHSRLAGDARWGGDIALPQPVAVEGEDDSDPSLQPLTPSSLQHLLSARADVPAPAALPAPSPPVLPLPAPAASDVRVVGPIAPSTASNPPSMPKPVVRLEPVYTAAGTLRSQVALFDSRLNQDLGAAAAPAWVAVPGGHAKRQKISNASRPVPFEHLCVPTPPSGRIVPMSEAKSYYSNHPMPNTLKQAMQSPFANYWLTAMLDEFESLQVNGTWELVPRTPDMVVIPCKWVFDLKYDAEGNVSRFKCRLVAGGHRQQEGIDYNETYAPVSRNATLRTFLSIAAWERWDVHQLDIKTAFLNGEIDTTVYMLQPPGFVEGTNQVCHLLKCLYGLKQAPRVWYYTLKNVLLKLGFNSVSADTSFWVRPGQAIVYLTTVVDDMLVASCQPSLTLHIVNSILSHFKGVHGGIAHHYSGFKLTWSKQRRSVWLTQTRHIDDMVAKFKPLVDSWKSRPYFPLPQGLLLTAKGVHGMPESPLLDVTKYPYRSVVGCLNYLAWSTRADIAYYVTQLSRWSNAPTVAHWEIAIRLLEYLDSTKHEGLRLGGSPVSAEAYVDSSHGTGTPDGWPVRGHVLVVKGGAVSWASKTIKLTTTSSTESEYRAMSECAKEALWLGQILTHFNVPSRPFLVKGDNKGAIHAVTNHAVTSHTKHIELHVQFIRERVESGELKFLHIPGVSNPADIFTKALGRVKFVAV